MTLHDTKLQVMWAIRTTAPKAVWGGVARRRSWMERMSNQFMRIMRPVLDLCRVPED
jgi:hypothetical protein